VDPRTRATQRGGGDATIDTKTGGVRRLGRAGGADQRVPGAGERVVRAGGDGYECDVGAGDADNLRYRYGHYCTTNSGDSTLPLRGYSHGEPVRDVETVWQRRYRPVPRVEDCTLLLGIGTFRVGSGTVATVTGAAPGRGSHARATGRHLREGARR
jgi:hypothetical protein